MAFISFNEGRSYLVGTGHGLPSTCYFLLSTKDAGTLLVTDTLAGGVAEATGTGYARISQAAPSPTAANPSVTSFTQMTWATSSATDWPTAVKSVVLVTTSDNTGKAICAWDVNGSAGFAMNAANTSLAVTPTLNVS